MIHARRDYDRFQDPEGKIPADEPVLILRGQDTAAIPALGAYADALMELGAEKEMVDAILKHRDLMLTWQAEHGAKVADADKAVLR